jgi:hypothetical protein
LILAQNQGFFVLPHKKRQLLPHKNKRLLPHKIAVVFFLLLCSCADQQLVEPKHNHEVKNDSTSFVPRCPSNDKQVDLDLH